jgi:hypothetical protein
MLREISFQIFLVEGNIQCIFSLVMVFCYGIEEIKTGIGKVNRQGYKVEPGNDQWIFRHNFMLIRLNLP